MAAAAERRRRRSRGALGAALLLAMLPSCGDTVPADAPTSAAPLENILLVTIDTLRADHVGAVGYGRGTTPNIDALARRGAIFTQAIAQSSWTRPSMAAVMTGLYPTTVGLTCHNFRNPKAECDLLPASVVTWAEALSENGYDTAAVVANINVDPLFGFDQGFDEMVVVPSVLAEDDPDWRVHEALKTGTTPGVTAAALDWLDGRDDDRPFFLYLHYLDPHEPYEPPAPHRERFDPASYDVPPASREPIALYDGEIQLVDQDFQRILDRLDAAGLASTTGVVILSDHGEEFGDHGGAYHGWTLYDEQLRVPLVMTLPGLTTPGSVYDVQVRMVDVMPTVLDALGVPAPDDLAGRSLVPLLRGGSLPPQAALSEWGYSPLVSWRAPPWKIIHHIEAGTTALYNLAEDPGETTDVAALHPDVVDGMRRQMEAEQDAARAASRRYVSASGDVELSAEQLEQMRALGYLGGEDR